MMYGLDRDTGYDASADVEAAEREAAEERFMSEDADTVREMVQRHGWVWFSRVVRQLAKEPQATATELAALELERRR